MVWRLKTGEGGVFSILSFFEVLLRRKLRPRMDLRPLFSSGGDSVVSMLGEAGAAEVLPLELLREKKGMPEGVRRGLSRLERERPGLVVTTAGVDEEDEEGGALKALAVVVVLELLWLTVLAREMADACLSWR